MKIPLIGFGTWQLHGEECRRAVQLALDTGYRHIDTAYHYENQREVAKAIKGFPREELFLTTKLAIGLTQIDDQNIEESVAAALDEALRELETDYLDLLLIHYPDRSRPLEDILAAMHKQVEMGKLRYPGVSNYTKHHLQDAYDKKISVPFNQVEFHPYLYQKDLWEFAEKHGTQLIAHRPFGKGMLLREEPLFEEIGKKHGVLPAQVVLRWIVQKGIPVIPKASSKKHMEENISIFHFSLTEEEMKQIDSLNKNFRYCQVDWSEFDY